MKSALALIHNIRKKDRPKRNGFIFRGEKYHGGIVNSYFMHVCSIVKTITPRCRGRPDALLHEAEGMK